MRTSAPSSRSSIRCSGAGASTFARAMRRIASPRSTDTLNDDSAGCSLRVRALDPTPAGCPLGIAPSSRPLGLYACAARFSIRGPCMPRPKDHLVSRVREIRMHGLNGGLTLTCSARPGGDTEDLPMQGCDAHCPFFSSRFLEILAKDRRDIAPGDHAAVVSTLLGWDPPGPPDALADRWIAELDRHQVAGAAAIPSIPGDEESVAAAIARHPARLVGFFMLNPSTADAAERLLRALGDWKLRGIS